MLPPPMAYDYRERKLVLLIADKLPAGVALNVAGHLSVSIGRRLGDDAMGRPTLLDRSGVAHAGICKYPVIVKSANRSQIRRAVTQARALADVLLADFPQQMLDTGHDDELAAALTAADEEALEYLGAAFFGASEQVDALSRKFSLWS